MFIHSSVDGCLGYFHLLVLECYTSFYMGVCFHFSWVISRLGISGPYGDSVFNLLRSCHSAFCSDGPTPLPTSVCEGPRAPTSSATLVTVFILTIAIVVVGK